MFKPLANSSVLRHFVAVWVVLLAGCIPQPVTPPEAAPSGFTAIAGNATVTLAWSASAGATGYNLQRATSSGGPYTQIAVPTSVGHTDSTVTNGTTYYYVVSAFNEGGETATSTQVSATPAIPSIPATPANVAATSGDRSVGISWTASAGATSYRVKRALTSGGPYTQVATPASATYSDTALTNGTTFFYVVTSVNSLGESANSAQASATPSPPPPSTFGTWLNVTPAGVDLVNSLTCGNYGTQTVQADPAHPSNLYAQFHCQGIWKSTDFGATWNGPINTGTNGAQVANCAGGIAISPTSTAAVPTIYQTCIRGAGIGSWKSVDGGVNWTQQVVAATVRQDYYPPDFDPYDQNHLVTTAHEFDSIIESFDGGQTWSSVPLNNGMLLNGGSSAIFFINTGNATTTRGTWLYIGDGSGSGTWRTTDSGANWVRVDASERIAGTQIYQPAGSGVLLMAGRPGISRSTDYGQSWSRVLMTNGSSVVFGTSKNIYSMYGIPLNAGESANPDFRVASQPGTGTWVAPGTPANLKNGPGQIAVVNDGTRNIVVGAMWNSGLWRYLEP